MKNGRYYYPIVIAPIPMHCGLHNKNSIKNHCETSMRIKSISRATEHGESMIVAWVSQRNRSEKSCDQCYLVPRTTVCKREFASTNTTIK